MKRAASLVVALVVSSAAWLVAAQGGQRPQMPPRGGGQSGQAQEAAPKGTSVLRGVVLAADTGTPVRRAQVRAFAPGVRGGRLANTDEQGRFEIRELVAGRYTLTASKGGFVSLQYGQRRPSEQGTPIDLGDGETIDKLVIGLPRGSVLAGRITDEFGEPVTDAVVTAMRYGYAGGTRRIVPEGRRDTTDDRGEFRLFGLQPGDYYVSAAFRMRGGEVTDPAGEPTGYAPTYYPGTPNMAEAQRVTVGVGQELSTVSFSLVATRLVRVSGSVVTSQGTPGQGVVTLSPAEGGTGMRMEMNAGRVDQTGHFEIDNVAPGRYLLQTRAGAGGGGRGGFGMRGGGEFGRMEIAVGNDNLTNVVVVTAPGATLSGRIVTDTGEVPGFAPQQLQVMAQPAELEMNSLGGFGGQARVSDDWSFELSNLFDARLFRVRVPQGWTLKAVHLDGAEVTDMPVTIPAGQSKTGLEIVLSEQIATLSGLVKDDRGQPVLDATIVVFPDEEELWMYQSRFIRAARPDQDGHYTIEGLPPHRAYLAVAVQGLEDGQAGDPDFLRQVRSNAVKFGLGEGEAKNVDIEVGGMR
ncbi:MAG: carboxypeptidase regulatory-like domain-containing protein [Vicinamibacterales bacterium]